MFVSRVKFDISILVVLCCCCVVTFGKDTVKYAAVIFRHGQRTPVDPYPTDPWRNESLWPVRFGELTNTGKMQHYALGQWFRKRYTDLISETFDPDEVYVKSTDYDRTLMSAQANLAGLFPPVGKAVWNNKLMWQPIPIHSESLKEDATLAMDKKCNAYNEELSRFVKSKEYKEKLSKYQKLMDYLTAYTGRKIKDYDDIEYIYSNLYIETLFNFTLPNWTQSVFPDAMKEPAGYSFAIHTDTPLLARLRAGPLIQQIMSHMDAVMDPNRNLSIKFAMYSAHDTVVANILNALDLFDNTCPVFTATVIFELIYNDVTDLYYVSISYRNSTEIIEPSELNISYCGKKCPIKRFKSLYNNLLGVDWEAECGNKTWSRYSALYYFISAMLFIVVYIYTKEVSLASRFYRTRFIRESQMPMVPTKDPPEVVHLTYIQ